MDDWTDRRPQASNPARIAGNEAVDDDTVNVPVFRDDDVGYRDWLADHPDGYVTNIARSHNSSDARVHSAECWTLGSQISRGVTLTGAYVKVCAETLARLDEWASEHVGEPIRRCGTCLPAGGGIRPRSVQPTAPGVARPAPEGRAPARGPVVGSGTVEAWADGYIRFEHRPVWQDQLRADIRTRCCELKPSPEQVLHATFVGAKRPNADVENLVLYNIGTFKDAGSNGIRFELGGTVPPASDDADYPFYYCYALQPRAGAFNDWTQGRTLASFDWTDLGAFNGEKKQAQVWLALARERANAEVTEQMRAPEAPFAVKVEVRPPHGQKRVWGDLMKGIFDGVACAFQAHTDTAVLPEVTTRLARVLPAAREELEELLRDQRKAVLGVVPRLVYPYRDSIKWDPADHWCVAGELLVAESDGPHWAIKGEVVELSR